MLLTGYREPIKRTLGNKAYKDSAQMVIRMKLPTFFDYLRLTE